LSFSTKPTFAALVTGITLAVLALAMLLVLIITHLNVLGLSVPFARFLLDGLSWMAFALPVYMLAASLLVLQEKLEYAAVFLYAGSLLPFAVMVFLVRFVEDSTYWLDTRPGLAFFGLRGVILLLSALTLALTGLLIALRYSLFPVRSRTQSAADAGPVRVAAPVLYESVETIRENDDEYSRLAFMVAAGETDGTTAVEETADKVSVSEAAAAGIAGVGATAGAAARVAEAAAADTLRVEPVVNMPADLMSASLPPLPPLNSLRDEAVPQAAGPEALSAGSDAAAAELPAFPMNPAGKEPSATGEAASEPSSDEPIPLMFRRSPPTADATVGRFSVSAADTLVQEVGASTQDPALSERFWDAEGQERTAGAAAEAAWLDSKSSEDSEGRSAHAPLMRKVEVFIDGTHSESLREVPGEENEKKKRASLTKPAASSATPADDFNIPVISVPPAYLSGRRKKPALAYEVPTTALLTDYPDGQYWVVDDKTRRAAEVLKETLAEFNIEAEVTGIRKGPVITMFEMLPAPGVRLSKIANLGDNIALRLAASSVRIVAPIPGKHAVGIEVPNEKRAIVSFKEIVETESFKSHRMGVPVVLGKDITGDVQVVDLTQTPHLLIAGATGSGKSVCVNSIILSILYRCSFNEVKLILIDPKVVELKLYNGIPHLLTPVITEPKRAFQALQYCICEMERRYSMLDAMGVRDIRSYNRKIIDKNMAAEKLPYIVVVIDEFADLMATTGKELEATLARLAAMSRAVGIHLVLATQRPSVDVITGLIKANIPSRIAFMVAGKFDSRIIIDMVGAEKLLGKGDMLYSSATDAFPIRMQGAFVSDEEVERVVEYVKTLGEPDYIDEEIFIDEEEDDGPTLFDDEDDDPLYEKALEIVLSQGKASASYLQRKLKIGYNRAARLVELMEEKGIVGPMQGSKPRDVMRNPDFGAARPPSGKARYVPDFSEEPVGAELDVAASDDAANDVNVEEDDE